MTQAVNGAVTDVCDNLGAVANNQAVEINTAMALTFIVGRNPGMGGEAIANLGRRVELQLATGVYPGCQQHIFAQRIVAQAQEPPRVGQALIAVEAGLFAHVAQVTVRHVAIKQNFAAGERAAGRQAGFVGGRALGG